MKIEKCRCGADARIRETDAYLWVECRKKCGMKTGVYHKFLKQDDIAADRAIADWNRLVGKKCEV